MCLAMCAGRNTVTHVFQAENWNSYSAGDKRMNINHLIWNFVQLSEQICDAIKAIYIF